MTIRTHLLTAMVAAGVTAGAACGGSTITPLAGSLGSPFNDGMLSGWGWNGVDGGGAGPLIGNLYDNILTINGGAATHFQCGGPFQTLSCQGFVDFVATQAQFGDDLHGLAGPAHGGPTAVITAIRYGYRNTIATATHTIQIYDMVPPSAAHPQNGSANAQFGARLLSLVLPGIPTGTAIVTVTGLSAHAGVAAWIKFGESGAGFPGTLWLVGGTGNGVGTTHPGFVYDNKNYYGPGMPLHYFSYLPYIYFPSQGPAAPNIQVALSGYVLPAPAAIALLGLGGLASLRHRRRPRS